MPARQPDDSEPHEPLSGDAASELWLDEALAETFPASDPIPWRRETPQLVETEAIRTVVDLSDR